jgi:uncharacterized membrane protein YbhN (UPF0104 family)
VVVVAAVVLLPQLTRLEASGLALARRWWLLPLALCLEAGSLLAYAELVRTVLSAAGQPIAPGLLRRATVAGYALGRTLPGGSMAALAVVTTELRGIGMAPATTAASLAASGLVSSVVLALLLPFALVLGLVGGEGTGIVLSVAGFAALVVLAALAARPTLRKPEAFGRLAERLARAVARGPLRTRLNPVKVGVQVTDAAQSLRDLGREPGVLWRAGGWAAANWLLDLAVLIAITVALGRSVPLWGLPLAYVLGQWTAAVPLTPGGVGLVESAMTAALVAAGVPASIAADRGRTRADADPACQHPARRAARGGRRAAPPERGVATRGRGRSSLTVPRGEGTCASGCIAAPTGRLCSQSAIPIAARDAT